MKKILAMLLAIMMIATCFAGCAPAETPAADTETPAADTKEPVEEAPAEKPAEEAKEPVAEPEVGESGAVDMEVESSDGEVDMSVLQGKKIGFAQCENNSTWRVAETNDFAAVAEKYGVELVSTDANTDFSKQASDIRDMIAQGCDYIICPPQQADGLQAPMKEAMDAGIPVILVDRSMTGEIGTHFVTEIMSDFVWEAEQCAVIVAEALGGKGNYVVLEGTPGASAATDRQTGFVNYMEANHPEMEMIASQNAEFNMDMAYDVMSNILAAQGDEIDAVFCHNDDMAQGAIKAIKAAGYVPGEDILIAGIDGPKIAIQSVLAGEQLVSVSCSPLFGEAAFKLCAMLEAGQTLDAQYVNADVIYTIDTAKETDGF